jgi:hypothetical protein
MKKIMILLAAICMVTLSCKKEQTTIKPIIVVEEPTFGFKAIVLVGDNSVKKSWVSASANKANAIKPLSGVDYFANRGGLNPNELTLMSFGKFTDDQSDLVGRITIFINNVSDTGSFTLDNNNYAVLSIISGATLKHYATDVDNKGVLNVTNYNTVNNTISGNFRFQAVSDSNAINLQNGTFIDIPFKQ